MKLEKVTLEGLREGRKFILGNSYVSTVYKLTTSSVGDNEYLVSAIGDWALKNDRFSYECNIEKITDKCIKAYGYLLGKAIKVQLRYCDLEYYQEKAPA